MDLNKPQRKGSQGRVADARMSEYKKYENRHYSCPPDLYERLLNYCKDEERAQSWVIQKALDIWLSTRGY